jgi:hypothetical protein
MRESCTSGSVRGVLSNEHPYRDPRLSNISAREKISRAVPHAGAIFAASRSSLPGLSRPSTP